MTPTQFERLPQARQAQIIGSLPMTVTFEETHEPEGWVSWQATGTLKGDPRRHPEYDPNLTRRTPILINPKAGVIYAPDDGFAITRHGYFTCWSRNSALALCRKGGFEDTDSEVLRDEYALMLDLAFGRGRDLALGTDEETERILLGEDGDDAGAVAGIYRVLVGWRSHSEYYRAKSARTGKMELYSRSRLSYDAKGRPSGLVKVPGLPALSKFDPAKHCFAHSTFRIGCVEVVGARFALLVHLWRSLFALEGARGDFTGFYRSQETRKARKARKP